MDDYVKRNPNAPRDFFTCEAAGLRWLDAAVAGVPCVRVIDHDATTLTLQRLHSVEPQRGHAYDFGRRLARTHAAGATAFGAPPDGFSGPGYFGPMSHPLPMELNACARWGEFYADTRLAPMAELAGVQLGGRTRDALQRVMSRCRDGDFDDDTAPARVHGDLWSGNVMWTSEGAVLIDPAAHGGHGETDLAMLALFGCPHHDAVLAGYLAERPLRAGWRQRVGLHQLFPLLAHVVLFGSSYLESTSAAIVGALTADS
ncbi:fructosamine kinase [Mycobacterium antarcticum]|uniref:fructosamine kinase family protein n=1 Tax=unclassified Mycolicibacterium TaxID=2636767 RepID=UPI0023A00E3D|nr:MULTISPECIES: fructosamine kinase family protein [unclassified Mycolicibacterium]BDX29610.1 fructosamine kinase [Mycolicibacterium sp. TUM20985]GLP73041.1 fructosamine kinase [Mycolicibacterium sp. TUM20983]GLP78756.1 fructosamine kinase [Mycolicibacterium sp. TUM20984]